MSKQRTFEQEFRALIMSLVVHVDNGKDDADANQEAIDKAVAEAMAKAKPYQKENN